MCRAVYRTSLHRTRRPEPCQPSKTNRRDFVKLGGAALAVAATQTAQSYAKIVGANDRVRTGIIGGGDRMLGGDVPAFVANQKDMNFELVAVSDIWKHARERAAATVEKACGSKIDMLPNNDALYARKDIDAVLIATADFQHARHGIEAVKAGRDAYVEKPTAHRMDDARDFLKAVEGSNQVIAVGTQRRSTPAYIKAAEYIQSGKFGDIVMVEMSWNVNQPGRWRRPDVVPLLKEEDTDWNRYCLGVIKDKFDARKYLEFRLFWPYSSGIPDQWLVHQIDTVHWFTGLPHPRSVVANGGIYLWKDGRTNWDTMTAVFDYGPLDDLTKGFQVQYTSRFTNSAGGVKELYYSNGGMIDMDKQTVTPTGGLTHEDGGRDEDAGQPAAQLLADGQGRKDGHRRQRRAARRSADHRQHAQLDGVRALAQDAERQHPRRLQPLHRAVHERGGDPDRPEGHLRREDPDR